MVELQQGDCLELMKQLPDASIDMILCDLPYGVTNCKWDVRIPLAPLWGQYKRVIKERGAIVLFAESSRLQANCECRISRCTDMIGRGTNTMFAVF